MKMISPRGIVTAMLAVIVLVAGCAQTRQVLRYETTPGAGTAVWPPPPEVPRYRFVGQLTGERNFHDNREVSPNYVEKFFRWLVGLAAGRHIPVELQRPQAVWVAHDGRIYVTDVSRQGVFVFDPEAGRLEVWDLGDTPYAFQSPIGIVEGKSGEIIVADSGAGHLVRLNHRGELIEFFAGRDLGRPTGLSRDPATGELYVADTQDHTVKVFSDAGQLQRTIGGRGEQPGKFNAPTYLAFQDRKLYVTDTLNARIQILSPDGEVLGVFGRRGLFIGQMPRPKGVAVSRSGRIYVVESYYDHLLIFDADGRFLLPIGGSGSGVGQFYLPAGVFVDDSEKVYVADMFNGRVVVLEFVGGGV